MINSIQDILNNKDEEIKMLLAVIDHPAGFLIDMFGGLLYIRSTYYEWEVGWKIYLESQEVDSHRLFTTSLEAVIFFVEKRHELQCGIDFEEVLMRERYNV